MTTTAPTLAADFKAQVERTLTANMSAERVAQIIRESARYYAASAKISDARYVDATEGKPATVKVSRYNREVVVIAGHEELARQQPYMYYIVYLQAGQQLLRWHNAERQPDGTLLDVNHFELPVLVDGKGNLYYQANVTHAGKTLTVYGYPIR